MAVKLKRFYLYLTTILFITIFPRQSLALEDKLSVTRSEVLNVAKEIHPPGCLDSRTADYCQRSSAYEVRGEIQGLLEQGMNKGQVIDHLVQKYGERILAAPAAEGFHLIPWLLPGIVMVLGGVLVAILIYRWVKKKPKDEEEENRSQPAFTKEDELKVQEELKNWL